MKKIISSILFIVVIISIHSCRQQDDEVITDVPRMNNEGVTGLYSKSTDTAEIIQPPRYPKTSLEVTDPPPKDHDQWKSK